VTINIPPDGSGPGSTPRSSLTPPSDASPGTGGPAPLRHLQILRSVNAAVSHSLNLNEVLQKSVSALTQVTGHEISSLHLLAADGRTLLLRGERGLSDHLRSVNQALPLGHGLIGTVAWNGRVRRLDQVTGATDLLPAARTIVAKDGIQGFVCVPIRARHRILGTLSLGRRTPDPFTDEEIALLETVADQIGLALDNARLYSETRQELEHSQRAQTEVVKAERLAAVEALAEGVAHEINNLLMIILGQVHQLLQSHDGDTILDGLKVIDGATRRAADIIRDLMFFAEHFPLRVTRCRVEDQVLQVLELHRLRLDARHVEIHTEIEESPEIWADAGHLQEAVSHLIQNAEQAMVAAHGGGTLTIRIGPSRLGVRMEVADDGPGILPEDLPRIFNPFFTTKPPGEGRGLGLSVAHRVIEEHNGRLAVENIAGGGAVFVIELPVGTPAATAISPA